MNPILARLQQHFDAERRGEYLGHAVPGALRPVSAVANAIGLAQEPFTDASRAAFGLMLAANAKANPLLRLFPDSPGADMAGDALRALEESDGNLYQKARAANEAGASGSKLRAFTTGVGAEGFNPLNYVGGIGRVGMALEEAGKLPLLARALKGAALTGEGLNRASILPLYLSRGGLERLVARPDWLLDAGHAAAPAARAVTPGIQELLDSGAARQAAKEATTFETFPVRTKYGGVPGRYGPTPPPPLSVPGLVPDRLPPSGFPARDFADVPGVVGKRADYDQAAKRAGLLALPKFVPDEASPLAPADFNLIRAAKERGKNAGQLPLTEAAPAAAKALPLPERIAAPAALPTQAAKAMPEFGGIANRAELGALSNREIDTLVDLAYPHDNALNNAMAKYTDDAALAGAAWDRVTKNPDLMQRLVSIDEPLARKLAFLPEREGAALADATPGQLADLIAEQSIPEGLRVPGIQTGGQLAEQIRAGKGKPRRAIPESAFGEGEPAMDLEGELRGDLEGELDDGNLSPLSRPGLTPPTPSALVGGRSAIADIPKGVGDIAAGGGGGGMKFVYPGVADVLAHPGAAASGILGAGVGAGLGAATDDEDRFGGALKGAGIGAAAGYGGGRVAPEMLRAADEVTRAVGSKLDNTMLDADMHADALRAGWQRFQAARGNAGVKGVKQGWDAFWAQWRSQVVNTLKQLPQDAMTRKFVNSGVAAKEFGIANPDAGLRQWQGILRRERSAGALGSTSLQNPIVAKLRALGQDGILADLPGTYGVDLGTSLDQHGPEFGGLGRTVAGAAIGLGAGARTVNPITAVTGAGRGYLAPFVDGYIRFLNGIQHDAQRFMLGDAALDRDIPALADTFLDELAARGVDVTVLRSRAGFFAPVEVAAVAGPQAAKDWQTLVEGTIRKQGDRIAFLAGDFREGSETAAGKVLSKVAPFSRWQRANAPVLAEIARRHPRATSVLAGSQVAAYEQAKEEKLKNYQYGTVAIGDKTPLVGLLARARLGGAEGTTRLDPLGALIPYGAGSAAGDELPEDPTGYQRVTNLAGRFGFQPNPVVQSLAYVTGQDYKAPGALSRTAGLEGLADTTPILLRALAHKAGRDDLAERVPDLGIPSGRALLDAGRELLSPVTGAGVSESAPETRRYAELVLTATGKPLMDPSNQGYVETIRRPDNPLWQRAVLESRFAGAAGNAAGMVSPVSTMAQTREAVAAQQAGKLPWSSYEISQATPSARLAMERENAAAIAEDPAVATYDNISPSARKRALIADWEARHARVKQLAPAYYAEQRKIFIANLR